MASKTCTHWTVDETPRSAVAICQGCQARFIASSRPSVMRELGAHLRATHPGEPLAAFNNSNGLARRRSVRR